jgi:hypothetical protein
MLPIDPEDRREAAAVVVGFWLVVALTLAIVGRAAGWW